MKNNLKLLIVLSLMMFIYPPTALVENSDDPDKSLRNAMEEGGYIPLSNAIEKFEEKYKSEVRLPKFPFKANHKVGVLSDEGYLKVNWINTRNDRTQTFLLFVRKSDGKDLYFANEKEDKLIKLRNGTTSYFNKNQNTYKLTFKKFGLEYCYLISKKEGLSKKEFLEIAESF